MTINNDVALENRLPRVDIREKVTGSAKFAIDMNLPRMIYGKMIRFPYGRGKVTNANVEAARAVPGVLEVEVDTSRTFEYPGMKIGHVAAETPDALEDAIAALQMRFEHEKPRTQPNELYQGVPASSGDDTAKLEALFQKAAAVVEATYDTQVQTHSSLETHGGVVHYKSEKSDVWGSTQATFGYQSGLRGVLDQPASRIEVHNEYTGGGFGSKFGPDKEGTLAAQLSKKYNRPCKVFLDRREEHLDTGNRPGSIQYMKLAVDGDGKLLGGRVHCVSVVGFTSGGGGITNPDSSLYNFGDIVRTEGEIQLNSGQPRAFRAPGRPPGTFAMESMMDELAAALGKDPVEFRKINDASSRRRGFWDRGAELIGWSNRKPDGTWPGIVKRGYGCAGSLWPTWNTKCEADCTIHRDGMVEVRSGVQDIGTGTFTVVADVAAHELQLPREQIVARVGNSMYPPGPASGGSVVSRSVAPATRKACRAGHEKLLAELARHWRTQPASISYEKGVFTFGERRAEWKEACAIMAEEKLTGQGVSETGVEGNSEGRSDCVQFAEVDVDTETGIVQVRKIVAIHSAGQIVNRQTIENQVYGGVIQGISYALFEDRLLDRNTGAMLNDDFLFYKIAGPVDTPEIIAVLDVNEGDTGVRPIGEPVTIPTSGAIANAVANALGARVRSLPITPEKVLAALDAKQKGATA